MEGKQSKCGASNELVGSQGVNSSQKPSDKNVPEESPTCSNLNLELDEGCDSLYEEPCEEMVTVDKETVIQIMLCLKQTAESADTKRTELLKQKNSFASLVILRERVEGQHTEFRRHYAGLLKVLDSSAVRDVLKKEVKIARFQELQRVSLEKSIKSKRFNIMKKIAVKKSAPQVVRPGAQTMRGIRATQGVRAGGVQIIQWTLNTQNAQVGQQQRGTQVDLANANKSSETMDLLGISTRVNTDANDVTIDGVVRPDDVTFSLNVPRH